MHPSSSLPTETRSRAHRKVLSTLITIIALTLFSRAAEAATWTVCAMGCDFMTIQAAVNAGSTNPGDTIQVMPGTYAVTGANLNKPLTLLGAQAGVDARGGRPGAMESIITTGGLGVFTLGSDITFDGFTFSNLVSRTIDTTVNADNFVMRNCILQGNIETPGSATYMNGAIQFGGGSNLHANGLIFEQNLVTADNGNLLYMGHSMDNGAVRNNLFHGDTVSFGPFGTRTGWLIEGNDFNGDVAAHGPYWGFGFNANLGDVVIRNNNVHKMSVGLGQISVVNGSITGNTFDDNQSAAFQLWGGEFGTIVSTNVLIEHNLIRYNGTSCTGYADASHGIRLRTGQDASTIHLHLNSFLDLGVGACGQAWAIRQNGTGAADAELNYWGTPGPASAIAAKFDSGAVDSVPEGTVDFTPWIASYTDDPAHSGELGFWPIINQTISVTMPAPASAANGSSFGVAATADSSLSVAITTSGGCSGSGSDAATITMTSSTVACVVHYNQAGNASYNPAPEVTSSTAASKGNQIIHVTMPAPASASNGSSFGVAATADSGLPVAITTTGGCTGSGSGSATITMTSNTVACVVHYNQAGNANYNAAPQVTSTTAASATATTTTILSDTPDPSPAGGPVKVSWKVTSGAATPPPPPPPGPPMPPGPPTGTVTVTDAASGATCSASVAMGSCTLMLNVAGTRNLTATYGGSATFAGSSGVAPHTVNAGPLEKLVLSPATATVAAGVSQAYTAEGFDNFTNSLGDKTASTSFTIAGGTCTSNNCQSTTAGSHTVTGSVGPKKGTATLTVTAAAAHHLAFSQQPTNTKMNMVIKPVTVQIVDAFNNVVASSASVSVALDPSSPAGATLSGTLTVNAVNGVATFNTLKINKAAKNYALAASSAGLTGATSNKFEITK